MGCGSSAPVGVLSGADTSPTSFSLSCKSAGSSTPEDTIKAKYTIGKMLGKGAFGEVFDVTDKAGRHFALKIISKIKFAGEVERQNMVMEVELMKRCRGHVTIVELFDNFEDKSNFYLAIERCTGGELMDAIVNAQHFSEAIASRYFRQMIEAVAWCHAHKVVHRDLKPENFLLAESSVDSALKLTDFGLAIAVQDIDAVLTDACGSAFYIAPEVFSKRYTRSADVWSLGVILYLLLSGNVPFGAEAEDEDGVYRCIQRDPLVFGQAFAGISTSARELLSGVLEKDPKKRYTAEQILAHPWLTGSAPDVNLDKKTLLALGSFNARNRFKRAAIKMVASTLKAADVAALRAQFMSIDTDATGFITYKEMSDALRMHFDITDTAKITEIIKNIDENGDGKLSYNEWLQAMLETRMLHHQAAIWTAFNTFDLNGDGQITVGEICSVLKGLSPEDARAYVAEFDTDGDGVIRYDEFLKMMLGKNLRIKITDVQTTAA